MADLIILTACVQSVAAINGILSRHQSLGIRQIRKPEIITHPNKDPGCLLRPDLLLRSQVNRFDRALIVFDREGCGREDLDATALASMSESQLNAVGWQGRARAIVIDPELENWVWSDSSQVDAALGWSGRIPALRSWVAEMGFIINDNGKPQDPKAALLAALQVSGKRHSSSIFLELAKTISLNRCIDPSFVLLKSVLSGWFPLGSA